MPNTRPPLILVVEDELDVRGLIVMALEQRQFRVVGTNDGNVGAEIMRAMRPDLVIADVKLRSGNGNELARLAQTLDLRILLISGEPGAIERNASGPVPFLEKPFRLAVFDRMLDEMLRRD